MQYRSVSRATHAAIAVALASGLAISVAQAEDDPVRMGIMLGFTGPIESLTPGMAGGAEIAVNEVNASGKLLGGRVVEVTRADSTCVDSGAATAAAERLVTSDRIDVLMGSDCSGVTTAVASNVAVPNGLPMISPSATAPALSELKDNGYFFRTVPSDARQGQILAEVLRERGVEEVAVSYTNNDYGKGFADAFAAAFEAAGGKVAISAAHEDGKADYTAEVAALSAAGAEDLVVLGYVDQGGKGIIQASIDTDAFTNFYGGDGMVGSSLVAALGEDIEGFVTTLAGVEEDGDSPFPALVEEAGFEAGGPYIGESYDAAALLLLGIQKAGGTDGEAVRDAIMELANAPGEPIHAGELDKALQIIADGGDIDYVGVTNVEMNEAGETAGAYKVLEVKDGEQVVVEYR
ncbi:MAG: branched-chain amino acid ABC transporter substrate-binding protein [Gammaproteobacteria bacterium]|nr:MAG: branched-chain amino acid ABC transporter substrate-binding protein [Gammaproteobacteria bacterium]PIE38392.1 MAG: branched-chain amino acid ABC transporter substrate-binding protein [Gammaproteobacteria bacterium]